MSASPPATIQPTTRRVPLWDNARWITVTLVVVGHAILKLIAESDSAYAMYLFIYAFHVPIFVAVSGYFAKSGPPGMRQLQRLLTDIVFPYVIFETIWTCVRWLLGGKFNLDYSTASWTLWFLLALIIWRITLPYLVMLRYPLLISIILSISSGYIDSIDSTFTLSRTIGLFPFFVFGWKLRQWQITDRWLQLRTADIWKWRAGALALLTTVYLLISLNIGPLRTLKMRQFLLYDDSYSAFGYTQFWAGGVRLAFIFLAFALIVAFLLLMPRRATWFTPFGSATMYIYLLHSFVLFPLRETGVLDGPQPAWALPGMIALSVIISVVLSLTPVRNVVRPFVEPRARWLFRPTAATPTGTIVLPQRDRK
ncbi:acyltransferase family protein [Cryobacterium psychrophilum]|uniref:Fucose 4-O-acetylase n=1 Tax=Cryobacterium psychrophilum TaxID=41988 RepID=A0A4Y8KIW0_9MICO|nr:acyltransferase family protein [Cryobacterium psychrophilum]TDW29247.1 fucose 4-O-acetylase-like acetyltransferase [Cryobacterium psychrophilum]TFD74685.1 fucose 4-O-acetylase [Cryobacterium psychrophilum]